MSAFGYLFIAAAILVIRQVIVGRVSDMGGDLRDFGVGLLRADIDSLNEVAARRGENVPASGVASGAGTANIPGPSGLIGGGSNRFANTVVELGDAADGYVWGATGPTSYDCSGLIWRALRDLGIYKGSRFTTSTFSRSVAPNIAIEAPFTMAANVPIGLMAGDILIWDGKHMGVYIGGGDYYSARSVSKGIGVSTVGGDSSYFGRAPRVWRLRRFL